MVLQFYGSRVGTPNFKTRPCFYRVATISTARQLFTTVFYIYNYLCVYKPSAIIVMSASTAFCSSCKQNRPLDQFKQRRNGTRYATCSICSVRFFTYIACFKAVANCFLGKKEASTAPTRDRPKYSIRRFP